MKSFSDDREQYVVRLQYAASKSASFACTCKDHEERAPENKTACKHFLAVALQNHSAAAPFLPAIEAKVLVPLFQELLAGCRRPGAKREKFHGLIDLCARRSAASNRAAESTGALLELGRLPTTESSEHGAAAASASAIAGAGAASARPSLPQAAAAVAAAAARGRLFGGEVVHVWPEGFGPGRAAELQELLVTHGATLWTPHDSGGDGDGYCDALVVADDGAGATEAVGRWWREEAGGVAVVLRAGWVTDAVRDGHKRDGGEYKLPRQPSRFTPPGAAPPAPAPASAPAAAAPAADQAPRAPARAPTLFPAILIVDISAAVSPTEQPVVSDRAPVSPIVDISADTPPTTPPAPESPRTAPLSLPATPTPTPAAAAASPRTVPRPRRRRGTPCEEERWG